LDESVITRAVAVAGGRFAPGHLGELTQQVPFEMAGSVLEETSRVQRRVRDVPARVAVYLDGLAVARPTAGALTQARRRLGPEPLRALFGLLRGPAAVPAGTAGARWRGLVISHLVFERERFDRICHLSGGRIHEEAGSHAATA
jgi:hypothetical protein